MMRSLSLLLALWLCPGSVQAQSALQLFEGSWTDHTYGCKHPWRITVSGDTIRFEMPSRESSSGISYYSTDEKILGVKDNIIDTVIVSKSVNNIFDTIGGRFTYTVEVNSFVNHVHRSNNDYHHTRCKGLPVAGRGGVPGRG
jgi:hypothetical protein